MVEIMTERLNQGLGLLAITETCPNSHNCLWSKRPNLFQIPDILPEGCPGESCEVIAFRKTLEENSPAFYAETLRLSRFDGVVKTTIAMAIKRKGNKRKRSRKLARRAYDLHIFGQLLILAIYPLFLETKEIPFLKPVEIEGLKDNFHDAEIYQTEKRMGKINSDWLEWMESLMGNLLSSYERYPLAIIYLVYLFLEGIEKDQLPDMKNMARDEKEKFFLEIEKGISQNRKTD